MQNSYPVVFDFLNIWILSEGEYESNISAISRKQIKEWI